MAGGVKKNWNFQNKEILQKIWSNGYSRPSMPHPRSSLTNYRTCDKREPVNSPGSSSCKVSGALTISFFSQTVEWQQAWLLSYLYGSLRRRGLTLATSSPPARFLVTPVQANTQTNRQLIYQWHPQLPGTVVIDELCHKTKKNSKNKINIISLWNNGSTMLLPPMLSIISSFCLIIMPLLLSIKG